MKEIEHRSVLSSAAETTACGFFNFSNKNSIVHISFQFIIHSYRRRKLICRLESAKKCEKLNTSFSITAILFPCVLSLRIKSSSVVFPDPRNPARCKSASETHQSWINVTCDDSNRNFLSSFHCGRSKFRRMKMNNEAAARMHVLEVSSSSHSAPTAKVNLILN